MSKYTFSDPSKTDFFALEFNGQIFAKGRGLFIHIMKYFPSIAKDLEYSSRSAVKWTPENFSNATHRHATHFKGMAFNYVKVDKRFRKEIRELSKQGEGWWPSRSDLKKPGEDYELTFQNFMMNYENPPHFVRRLGRGLNVDLEKRLEMIEGVDFTRVGFEKMISAYRKAMGSNLLISFELPYKEPTYYHIGRYSYEYGGMRSITVPHWRQWCIVGEKKREEYIKYVESIELPK